MSYRVYLDGQLTPACVSRIASPHLIASRNNWQRVPQMHRTLPFMLVSVISFACAGENTTTTPTTRGTGAASREAQFSMIGPDGLPNMQALAHVVRELDELCVDTFCESGVSYDFETITCAARTCWVSFTAMQFGENDEEVRTDGRVSVSVNGWSEVINPHGTDRSVSESFLMALGGALSVWEAEHPSRR